MVCESIRRVENQLIGGDSSQLNSGGTALVSTSTLAKVLMVLELNRRRYRAHGERLGVSSVGLS
jgi:hypothetical protein